MPRQHIARLTFNREVNALHIVTFKKDVLFIEFDEGLHYWANPGDEINGFVIEEIKLFDLAFVNE